jgi:NADH dehydrogenase
VIIVGGGAGGAELAAELGRRFGGSTLNVSLVDCAPSHFWKPRLHELAAGLLGAGEEETAYLALGRANHFSFHLGALTAIDPEAKSISISAVKDSEGADFLAPRDLHYDKLVLAIGSQVNDFGVKGVLDHCLMLDTGEQALAFQRRFLEMAVRVSDKILGRLRVGIVGAGATGVELAAELNYAVGALHRFGGLMSPDKLEITLIDKAARVLPNIDPATSEFAAKTLERMGVRVRLNAGVQEVTAEGLVLEGGELVPCDLRVWASGVIGRPVAAGLSGLKVDRLRRIVCDDHLRCEGLPGVYALGDCAAVQDPKTHRPLPATAQVAHQQAHYLAQHLGAPSNGAAPFAYHPRGSLVSLGSEEVVGEIPAPHHSPLTISGVTPKLAYASLGVMHRAVLLGWREALAQSLVDSLRRTAAPPIKLH